MKKKLISSGIIAGFLAFLLALMPLLKDSSASALGYDSSSNSIVYTHYANKRADNAAELGSAENPYIIMELVPKDDMAMMGYLVSNQERSVKKRWHPSSSVLQTMQLPSIRGFSKVPLRRSGMMSLSQMVYSVEPILFLPAETSPERPSLMM